MPEAASAQATRATIGDSEFDRDTALVRRAPGVTRHLAAAEFGAGVFFDPVDPRQAAAQLRLPSA